MRFDNIPVGISFMEKNGIRVNFEWLDDDQVSVKINNSEDPEIMPISALGLYLEGLL